MKRSMTPLRAGSGGAASVPSRVTSGLAAMSIGLTLSVPNKNPSFRGASEASERARNP